MKRLAGRSAFSVGAPRGIRRGFAHLYVQGGASLAIGDVGCGMSVNDMPVFLDSPESDYIVSQSYNLDGGQWMS